MLHPAGQQKDALDRLSKATKDAVERLQAACPDDVPLTPLGRLEAMEKRLEAMLHAAALVQPAMDEFYAALSNEQKARFNTLQQVASFLQQQVTGVAVSKSGRIFINFPAPAFPPR